MQGFGHSNQTRPALGFSAELRDHVSAWGAVLDLLPIGYFVCDPEGRLVRYNRSAAVIWGRAPAIGDRQPWGAEAVLDAHGKPLGRDDVPLRRILRSGRSLRGLELIHQRRNGTRVAVQVDGDPIRGGDGRLIGAVVWVRDVTRRQRGERALRESEQRFRRIFEQSPLGKATIDVDLHLREVNAALCAMVGYPSDELVGMDVLKLVHPEDRQTCRRSAAALADGEIGQFQLELRFVRKSDEPIWVNVNIGPVRDAEGRMLYGLAIIENIDERRRSAEALRDSEGRLKLAQEAAEIGTWERSLETGEVRWSPEMFRIYGLDPDRAAPAGSAWLRSVHPDDRARLRALVRRQSRRVEAFSEEYRIRRSDGLRWILSKGTTIADPTGRPARLVGICMDVTERRFTEEGVRASEERYRLLSETLEQRVDHEVSQREAAQAALLQAQKLEAIGRLTGGVAHDFNNLLTAVIGNLDLLAAHASTPEQRQRIDAALGAAQRGAQLTQQLLTYGRRQTLETCPVNVNNLIDGMEDMLRRSLGGLVAIETRLAPDLWPASTDPTQLELVILNLAINARDAMPSGGTLQIGSRNVAWGDADMPGELAPGDYVELSVVDDGIGMTRETLEKAIEPFFTTKAVGKGSGLGLSQVYGVATQSGGTMRLDSSLGAGTRVAVWLPRSARPAQPEDSGLPAVLRDEGRDRLLVIDDDADVRSIAVSALEAAGYAVEEAASGRQALAMLDEAMADGAVPAGREPFALAIVDFAMPGMAGDEWVRRARQKYPTLAAVYVTGHADPAPIERDGETIIRKPYRVPELLRAIEDVLQKRQPTAGGAGKSTLAARAPRA